ncbi:MAG: DUF4838 domain-containing protein [Clostridia bacterium]|nr:DUF4838 domain-containing protein [Clostridia bacterium]
MKKTVCIILTLCLLFAAAPAAMASGDVTVDSSWSVLVPESPTSYESFAAEKLASCLSEIFDAQISLTTSAQGSFIAIGSASGTDVSGVADNGYRIEVINGCVHINGTAQRGLQAGVYRFLEQFCSRKVYTSAITVMPKAQSIAVPAGTDIVYEPFFESTDTDWRSPHNTEYAMANGLTNGANRYIPAEMGGSVNYLGGFCHTIGGLCETASYKDSHPEYLALHDGERTVDQPCLTNPDVLAIATANVLAILRDRHDPNASLQIVSVTQNDNQNYCECENCAAFEAAHGGRHSATMVNFVNQIADAVAEAGYDNVAVDTFAYQYTQAAPQNIKPRDNVIIRICSIDCCQAHAFDADCNKEYLRDLEDWSKICGRIYTWDYATHFLHPCNVFPDFGRIQKNIQILYEHNVKGVFVEGNYFIDSCDTEFGELRAYMIAKCLQDPYCDLDSEIDGFLDAYYGPGGKYVRKVLDIYTKQSGSYDGHMNIWYGSWSCMRPISSLTAALINHYWKTAEELAETDQQLANLERSELSWRWWKANAGKSEFSFFSWNRADECEKLFDDLRAHGVTLLQEFTYENLDEIAPDVIRYAVPDRWHVGAEENESVAEMIKINKLAERFPPLFGLVAWIYNMTRS